ncbi:MAG: DUF1622 domain-containing protein [Microcoleaceae cyanobacterium]
MEILESLEHSLANLVAIAKFILEGFSVVCVIVGFIKTLQLAWHLNSKHNSVENFNKIRLRFGMWLALALEFQLGADVLSTTIAPSINALGQLALIAIIRTFLNYFLGKELEAELALAKEHIQLLQEKASIR